MTNVTNGSHIHVYARAHTHVYTSICKSIVTIVTGRQAIARDNMSRVGGSASWFLAKHQQARCSKSHAWQAKLTNSLINQYPDQIGSLIWSLAASFSWAGTIPEVP